MTHEAIQEAVNKYEDFVGLTKGRKAENIKKKSALICSMHNLLGMGDREITKYVDCDRTTVLYHRRKHEHNKQSWPGYSTLYEVAKQSLQEVVEVNVENDKRINYLLDNLHKLNKKLTSPEDKSVISSAILLINHYRKPTQQ